MEDFVDSTHIFITDLLKYIISLEENQDQCTHCAPLTIHE